MAQGSPYATQPPSQAQAWTRPEPAAFAPAPSLVPVPGVASMTPAQVDLLRYVVGELEILLRVTTLVRPWELAAVEAVTTYPEAAVRAGLLSLLDYCERKPRHRPGPKYLTDRVAEAAESPGAASQGARGARGSRETPHQRANRDSPFPTDIEVWRGYARAIGQEE